ncbi:MAG: SpoIIE family protein phosphatase [Sulfuricella sp.]|nr:SpoIIE family protein phosphatase [Sulfuricella sp.]
MASGKRPDGPTVKVNKFSHGLTFKQATVTLGVVVLLGLFGYLVELFVEWQNVRQEVRSHMQQTFALVKGTAAEAAYQLHPELSRQVVEGLFGYDALEKAVLKDNFGRVLAEKTLSRNGGGAGVEMTQGIFTDVTQFSLPLDYAISGKTQDNVGQLDITLSARVVAEKFIDRVAFNGIMALVRDIAISVVVVMIFYFMITLPLLRLSRAIAQVDPDAPGKWPVPRLKGHDNDELGLLQITFNNLLQAFQRGLDQRNQAQQELVQLTLQLEQRVQERTHDLEEAMAALAEEKAEAERAFAQLDHTHSELEKANRLVLESIQYARRIQSAMLPDKHALGDAVKDIHVWWEPLHVVGGDYFWLERFGNKSLLLVADCTGHGVPGAFITLVVASALDRVLHEHKQFDPAEILRALDEMVRVRLRQDRPDSESDDGLDAAVCLWDSDALSVTFAGAGLPLIYAEDGIIREIRGGKASLAYSTSGQGHEYVNHVIPVKPGMAFYMLTDGVSDHMGGKPKRLLGRKRLAAIIQANAGKPMSEQVNAIQQTLDQYRGQEPRRDDTTLLGFTPL